MGEWDCKSVDWWAYRVPGFARPYGHVVRHREDGPEGMVWDAIVIAGPTDDETAIAERVSFDEAKAALEQHAAQHATWM
jgi:hypothetical protein